MLLYVAWVRRAFQQTFQFVANRSVHISLKKVPTPKLLADLRLLSTLLLPTGPLPGLFYAEVNGPLSSRCAAFTSF